MGEYTEKAKGAANEAMGNTKQALGEATDSPELKKKGLEQEAKGEFQKTTGEVEGALSNDV